MYERDVAVGGLNTEMQMFCYYVDQIIVVKNNIYGEKLKRSCIIDLTVILMKKYYRMLKSVQLRLNYCK